MTDAGTRARELLNSMHRYHQVRHSDVAFRGMADNKISFLVNYLYKLLLHEINS